MAQRLVWLGMLVIVIDVKLNSFDVLPDVVGWALVLVGLLDLRTVHPRFRQATGVAVAGLAASALHLALFFSEKRYPVSISAVEVAESVAWWLLAGCVLWAVADLLATTDRGMAVVTRRLLVVLLAVGASEVVVRFVVLGLVAGRGHLLASQGWVATLAHLVLLVAGGAAALWVAHCDARHPVRRPRVTR